MFGSLRFKYSIFDTPEEKKKRKKERRNWSKSKKEDGVSEQLIEVNY